MNQGTEPVEIREACVDDTRGIQEVVQTTWDDTYSETIPEDVRRRFISQAYSAESLRRRMASNVFLVAAAGGEVYGFADFRTLPGTEVELSALYVLPEAQRRGNGTRLLETGIARFPPGTRVVLRVEQDNVRARRFYRAHGFTLSGEHELELYGHTIPVVEMVFQDRYSTP